MIKQTEFVEKSEVLRLFAILFAGLVLLYNTFLRNYNFITDKSDFDYIKNIFLNNMTNHKHYRKMLNRNEVITQLNKKYLNSKSCGNFTAITGFNTTFISNSFFSNLEFAVAEMCIIYANLISKETLVTSDGSVKTVSNEIKELAELKIVDLITAYAKLWHYSYKFIISLFIRIMKNLCFTEIEDNVRHYEILNVILTILKNKFKFKVYHFAKYLGLVLKEPGTSGPLVLKEPTSFACLTESTSKACLTFDKFRTSSEIWTPDLEVKLNHLSALMSMFRI